jgi:hypothetical protein
MLSWLFTIEARSKGELPVTEGLWLARVRKHAEKTADATTRT